MLVYFSLAPITVSLSVVIYYNEILLILNIKYLHDNYDTSLASYKTMDITLLDLCDINKIQ